MSPQRSPFVAGNWKMNGLVSGGTALARDVARLASEDDRCEIAICPPATLLTGIAAALSRMDGAVALGAQDCAVAESGAFTGDISARMLADVGCRYVILGHSERRAGHGETNDLVRKKAAAAHDAGLIAIICVGESEAERDDGRTLDVVGRQVDESLPCERGREFIVAYEPVWAIGTGRTPSSADITEVHGHIRRRLELKLGAEAAGAPILYGGSVKPDNAGAIASIDGVDGALVGGASLKAGDFWRICQSWAETV